jgi:hypothetical protein
LVLKVLESEEPLLDPSAATNFAAREKLSYAFTVWRMEENGQP